jgi:hypothetical protein
MQKRKLKLKETLALSSGILKLIFYFSELPVGYNQSGSGKVVRKNGPNTKRISYSYPKFIINCYFLTDWGSWIWADEGEIRYRYCRGQILKQQNCNSILKLVLIFSLIPLIGTKIL